MHEMISKLQNICTNISEKSGLKTNVSIDHFIQNLSEDEKNSILKVEKY